MFTGKAYWGEAADKNYLCGADKDDLLTQLKLLRDSPSESLFREREAKLLSSAYDLWIRPGRVTKPVRFVDYYERNWQNCTFRWIFAFRKNLPTHGANDTQAVESTFRAIKHYVKVEFGRKCPSLEELILVLPKILDKRSSERELATINRRVIFHHKNPKLNEALERASWDLNAGGMKVYFEALKMSHDQCDRFEVDGETIIETYSSSKTAPYKGTYKTNGFICNCSWFSSRKICRHPFVYRYHHNMALYDKKIFHSSFLIIPDSDDVYDDEVFEDNDAIQEAPGSPGMAHLLEEQKRANMRLKKNVKFNRAFDTAKVAAEYLSHYSNDLFEVNLKAFQQFTDLIRVGLPDELVKYLNDEKSSLTCTEKPQLITTVANKVHVNEVPDHIKPFLGNMDLVVFPIKGDGACLYGSASAHIYHDEDQMQNFRKIIHQHIINNWWHYSSFITFPYTETVGVGKSKYTIHLETETEYLGFLLSERSMYCYGDNVDLAAISNVFNINIAILTYGLSDGLQPRWTSLSPDPVVSAFSQFAHPQIEDIYLIHSDNNHFDLLLDRHSRLAVEGPVPF